MKAGDLVKLKSGGPVMTVEAVYPAPNLVICEWFVNGELRTARFPKECLVEAKAGRK